MCRGNTSPRAEAEARRPARRENTLSRSERRNHPTEDWSFFNFDQTHILTLIGSYKFGHGYQVGLRFRYVTGNPFTPNIGSFFDANNGSYASLKAPPFSGRLDAFNQLDARFDKSWAFKRCPISGLQKGDAGTLIWSSIL